MNREEQLKYYMGWTDGEKKQLRRVLEEIPVLNEEFDIENDVTFNILRSAGMSPALVCKICGDKVEWVD